MSLSTHQGPYYAVLQSSHNGRMRSPFGASAQARELVDLTNKGKELRVRIKELNEALEKEQSATALATAELQVTFQPIQASRVQV